MIMFIYITQNYILKYVTCIICIMSIIKACVRLLRLGGAGAERMRRRATAGTRPQPGGYVSMFQDSDPAPGHRAADPAPHSPIAMAALPRLGFGSSRRHRRSPVSNPARSGVFCLSRRQ